MDAGYAISFVTSFVALRNVILAGTPEQGKYFADIVKPGRFAAFALTEPNAGSDPGAMRATAVKDGEEYILNGNKTFITSGALASVMVGFFKTSPDKGNKGISAFIIDADAPGITIGKHENKMGLRLSNTTDVTFENVRVKESAMLGPEGSRFKLALNALNLSRAFVATMAAWYRKKAPSQKLCVRLRPGSNLQRSADLRRVRLQQRIPGRKADAGLQSVADLRGR